VTAYLVEEYRPNPQSTAEIEDRARRAVVQLSETGVPVTYERSIFIPDDELCLHLLHGPSREAILEAVRRAGISPVRVVETAA
jgi:hypothetical protein